MRRARSRRGEAEFAPAGGEHLWPVVALTAITSGFAKGRGDRETIWSPYYRIDYYPDQQVHRHEPHQPAGDGAARTARSVAPYALPYLFQRDLKKPDGTRGVAGVQADPHHRRRQRQRRGADAAVGRAGRADRRGRDRPGHPEDRRGRPPGQAVPGPARPRLPQRRAQLPPREPSRRRTTSSSSRSSIRWCCSRATRTCASRATCSRWNRSRTCSAC